MLYVIDMVRRDGSGRVTRVHWHMLDADGHVEASEESDAQEVAAKVSMGARVNLVIAGRLWNGIHLSPDGRTIIDGPGTPIGARLVDMPQF